MAIRDTYVHPISDGDQLNDGYFNSLPIRIIDTDTTTTSITNTTGTAVILTVPAADILEFIEITIDYEARTDIASPNSTAIQILKSVSGTQTQLVSREVLTANISGATGTFNTGGSYTYYFAPSSGEKTSGFDIVVKGVCNSANNTLYYKSSYIKGR